MNMEISVSTIEIGTHRNYTDSYFRDESSALIARQVFPFNLHPVHCTCHHQHFYFEYLTFDQNVLVK